MNPALSARWNAVHDLQKRRSAFPQHSLQSRIADHAAVLAMSARREPTPYLAHNALNDARIIVLRQDKREQRLFPKPFYGTPAAPDSLEVRHEVDGLVDAWVEPTPLEILDADRAWRDHYARIRAALVSDDPRFGEVFDDWRDEVSVEESAARLGISRGYVKKLRLNVSAVARSMRLT